jgi:hypothetical protein
MLWGKSPSQFVETIVPFVVSKFTRFEALIHIFFTRLTRMLSLPIFLLIDRELPMPFFPIIPAGV